MTAKNTFVLVLLAMLLAGLSIQAQESGPSEYQVKAAFLYNFAKFVKWPEQAFAETNTPITIGILGEDPFGSDLALAIQGKTVNGHPLKLKQINSVAEIKLCQVIFVCQKPKRNLGEMLAAIKGTSILTVSEIDGFTTVGGMINFVMDGPKVRFEINDAAAREAGLTISSKLLNLRKKERAG